MVQQRERLWEFDAVEPGQEGNITVVEITAENIAGYAWVALNSDERYLESGDGLAMPTMVLSYAPLLREEIAEANGFLALEQSKTARRQTPFAKCEIHWERRVMAGDAITGTRRVLEKYERRGSKFVTFRVEASNQAGLRVGYYDYTCIFEYAKGQRETPAPATPPTFETLPDIGGPEAVELDFQTAEVGQQLARLLMVEDQKFINARNAFRLAGRPSESNIHTDEEFARQNIFGGTVNAGPATMSYVDQMLQLSFPLEAFYNGGSLLMRAITPFRADDSVTFQGEITGKRQEGEKGIVESRVRGVNQRDELVCLADAAMVFDL